MTGKVEVAWGDGNHTFALRIGQLRELQAKCEAGPAEILQRLAAGKWRVDDIRETVRLGLIGGGMKPPEALTLVQRYVDDRPLLESLQVAQAAIMMSLVGDPDDDVGKQEAEKAETKAEQTDA